MEELRINIYNYLYDLFFDVVTQNVYSMQEPQELTSSDKQDGFMVLHVGNIEDAAEFNGHAYGWVRCYVECFIPPRSRGRLDYDKYRQFESAVTNVINQAASQGADGHGYAIQLDSILSMDDTDTNNADNMYFTFIKSFIITL